jgi:hypothetical protein
MLLDSFLAVSALCTRFARDATWRCDCLRLMKQPLKSLIAALILLAASYAAAAEQQHRPFARPAAAYAPLFGERAKAAKKTSIVEYSIYFVAAPIY